MGTSKNDALPRDRFSKLLYQFGKKHQADRDTPFVIKNLNFNECEFTSSNKKYGKDARCKWKHRLDFSEALNASLIYPNY